MSENGAFVQSENGAFIESENGARGPSAGPPPPALVYHSQLLRETSNPPYYQDRRYTYWEVSPASAADVWIERVATYQFNQAVPDNYFTDCRYNSISSATAASRITQREGEGYIFQTYPTYANFYATAPWGAGDARNYPAERPTYNVFPTGENFVYQQHCWQQRSPTFEFTEDNAPKWSLEIGYALSQEVLQSTSFNQVTTVTTTQPNTYLYEDVSGDDYVRIEKQHAAGSTLKAQGDLFDAVPPEPTITLTDESVVSTAGLGRYRLNTAIGSFEYPIALIVVGPPRDEEKDWFGVDHTGRAPDRYVQLEPDFYWTIDSFGNHDYYMPLTFDIERTFEFHYSA